MEDCRIDSQKTIQVGRRSALVRVAALAAGFLSGARSLLAQKRLAISLDKAEKLKAVGGSVVLKVQDRDVLFVREAQDKVRALNPVCSHNKCTVGYDHSKKRIVCPCHGSNFDLDGGVLNGPAQKPLQVYEASLDLENGRIVFTLE